MGLLGVATAGLRAVADAVERVDGGGHGPWCEESKGWDPDTPMSRVVPIRAGDEYVARMFTEDGWQANIGAVLMRPNEDGTFNVMFREADEPDLTANRAMQRMVATALDLAMALEMSNCDLSDEAVEALSEFRRASRSRLSGMSG